MKKKTLKLRADQLLVEQNQDISRSKAQALILSGVVYWGDKKIEKSSDFIKSQDNGGFPPLLIKGKGHPYVGRGGVKLKGAIDEWGLSVSSRIALDIGASTGGFSDCLLQEGLKKVYALDVGRNQLDWKLRNDDRVIVLEKINFRYYDFKDIIDPIDLIVCDVSFISLTKIIPKMMELIQTQKTKKDIDCICLIKPQFECDIKDIERGGIVRDESKRKAAVSKIKNFVTELGFQVQSVLPSSLKGQDGNQEYLIWMKC